MRERAAFPEREFPGTRDIKAVPRLVAVLVDEVVVECLQIVKRASVLGGAISGRIRRRNSGLAGLSAALERDAGPRREARRLLYCSRHSKFSCEPALRSYCDDLPDSCRL